MLKLRYAYPMLGAVARAVKEEHIRSLRPLAAHTLEVRVYEIAGDTFGPEDNYGIGLPLDSDGVAFVNDFLKKIEDNGTWAQLWKISLGDRTGIENVPEAPVIE